jgi:pyridoxal phosphate enzyme (YggS family)
MAVSKFHPREAVEAAYAAGQRLFGENRVQEAAEKFGPRAGSFRAEHPGLELHMIGSLQKNKVKEVLGVVDCIQSVDRDELLVELEKRLSTGGGGGRKMPVLLEINAGEESKGGFRGLDSLLQGAEKLEASPHLLPAGLMIMAPLEADEAGIRRAFRLLQKDRAEIVKRFSPAAGSGDWEICSMGMSGDCEIAVEEGSTLLSIGPAIFGEREK